MELLIVKRTRNQLPRNNSHYSARESTFVPIMTISLEVLHLRFDVNRCSLPGLTFSSDLIWKGQ